MSFIFINSAYRDRFLYPHQADFIIPFQTIHSLENNLNVLNTINPICVYPIYSFCWTNFLSTNLFEYKIKITGGSGVNIQLDLEIFNNLLGIDSNISNFYVYQNIDKMVNILNNYIILLNGFKSIILSYSPTYNTITIADLIPFSIGDDIIITNDVTLIDPTLNNQNAIIMNGDLSILTYNNPLLIYNIDLNEKRNSNFNTTLQVLELENSFSQPTNPTNKYLLFNDLNLFILGSLELFHNQKYYIENFIGDYQFIDSGQFYQLNQKIFLVENEFDSYLPEHSIFIIKDIDHYGQILNFEIEEIGWQTFMTSKIYFIKPLIPTSGIKYARILINSLNTIFKYKIKNTNNVHFHPRDFIGNYFQCILLSPLYTIMNDQLYLSPNFTIPTRVEMTPHNLFYYQNKNGIFGITKVFFMDRDNVLIFVEKISSILLKRFDIYYHTIDSLGFIPNEYNGCLNGLIYNFIKEGIVPLNFSGTYLTQSTMSCYEINVLSLILPNVPIVSLNSYLTSAFPFVLFEISNVSMPNSNNKNIIYSNNPYTTNTTFICPISDISSPIISKFIKINSAGMSQIIKFTPADNLRFRLLLPNGNLFMTQSLDNSPPAEPNPLLQMGVVLEIKKL